MADELVLETTYWETTCGHNSGVISDVTHPAGELPTVTCGECGATLTQVPE